MKFEEVSIHARAVGRSCGCHILPEYNIVVEPGFAGEMLHRLNYEKLVLVKVTPMCWKRIAKNHRQKL